MKSIALQYISAFGNKDLATVGTLLSADVTLRDWEVDLQGHGAVLAQCARTFEAVPELSVTPLKLHVDASTVVAELSIGVGGGASIRVVDVIEFDGTGRICAIRAYKG